MATVRDFMATDELAIQAYGTSEGADKGWDTRGRGRAKKNFEPPSSVVKKNKGYAEVNMSDVLRHADKEKMKGMSNDEAYSHLMDAHDKAVKELHDKGHEEVGHLSNSKIGDWVDSRYDQKTGYKG